MIALLFLLANLSAQDFRRDVAPVLEANCVGCHNAQRNYAGLRLDTSALARKGGLKGPAIVAGQPDKSTLLTSMELMPGKAGAMPPGGPQVAKASRDKVRQWIAAGAVWPDAIALGQGNGKPDERAIADKLHARIVGNAQKNLAGAPYKTTIPGTVVSFEMVPIPAGEFLMGSPVSERGRRPDEGPLHRVKLEAFWMGKHEVAWDEYRLFMFAQMAGETAGADPVLDAVSRPTRPYVEMSFGMGLEGYPAISMTQHASNKYSQWLSARTGHFYRLPTEAEWEYACRAGADIDAATLGEYAWFAGNSNGKYEKVGTKKPNAWGLHDMLGNVMEWTLDQYAPHYSRWSQPLTPLPWLRASKPYPHSVRGGSWNDDAVGCRCAARVASDASWKMQDPQLPKSIWYHTDAQWLGFRLVRPVRVPSAAEMFAYWNNGVEKE
ncbi:MAG: SUMF1/EgtB/PvdO family nonheme iron enzyme [Candidatus Solibacter usitatus]|nr:SUMF1/EgtB/PvdO family nonheme iron enzyme [Candidatus Solibacter usitatus]